MATETTVNGNTVWVHPILTHRWLDAVGPDVCKLVEEFVNTPFSAADNMAGWSTNEVDVGLGDTTVTMVAGSVGGEVIFKSAENDNDGVQAQVTGEAFDLSSRYPTYVGARFKAADVDQTDMGLGLCITDTSLLTAVSDGLYFRVVDESPTLTLVAEKDNAETVIGLATLANDTYVIAEYLYLNGTVTAYINGVEVATLADSDPNFPDDEYLTPSIAMLAGAAAAGTGKTMTVDWLRIIQIQAL